MPSCPQCGIQLRQTAKFCYRCGAAVEPAPSTPPSGGTRFVLAGALVALVVALTGIIAFFGLPALLGGDDTQPSALRATPEIESAGRAAPTRPRATPTTAAPLTPTRRPATAEIPRSAIVYPLPPEVVPLALPASGPEREIFSLLNRANGAYMAALESTQETPLQTVYTAEALDYYLRRVRDLRDQNRYESNRYLDFQVLELDFVGTNRATATTFERWRFSKHDARTGEQVSCGVGTYNQHYEFVRIGGGWFISVNTFTRLGWIAC